MLTLARLHQVISLAEHANFHRSAAALKISQPSLSKSIRTLETALGVQLFDRRAGAVELTEFGELVVEHATQVAAAESDLLHKIGLLAGRNAGLVKVALG